MLWFPGLFFTLCLWDTLQNQRLNTYFLSLVKKRTSLQITKAVYDLHDCIQTTLNLKMDAKQAEEDIRWCLSKLKPKVPLNTKKTLEWSYEDLHRQNTYLHRCQIHLLRTKKKVLSHRGTGTLSVISALMENEWQEYFKCILSSRNVQIH